MRGQAIRDRKKISMHAINKYSWKFAVMGGVLVETTRQFCVSPLVMHCHCVGIQYQNCSIERLALRRARALPPPFWLLKMLTRRFLPIKPARLAAGSFFAFLPNHERDIYFLATFTCCFYKIASH